MNIIKASIFSLFLQVLQRIYLAEFHFSSEPIVNVWAILDPGKKTSVLFEHIVLKSRQNELILIFISNVAPYIVYIISNTVM